MNFLANSIATEHFSDFWELNRMFSQSSSFLQESNSMMAGSSHTHTHTHTHTYTHAVLSYIDNFSGYV